MNYRVYNSIRRSNFTKIRFLIQSLFFLNINFTQNIEKKN